MQSLKYTQITAVFDPTFWTTLYSKKLNEFKQNIVTIPINCLNTHVSGQYIAKFSDDSFEDFSYGYFADSEEYTDLEYKTKLLQCFMTGSLTVVNTLNEFNELFKKQNEPIVKEIWSSISSGSVFDNSSEITQFAVTIYVDLKKYKFYYWISFPVFKISQNIMIDNISPLSILINNENEQQLIKDQIESIWKHNNPNINCFVCEDFTLTPLNKKCFDDGEDMVILYIDNGNSEIHANWTVRNMIFTIGCYIKKKMYITMICYRNKSLNDINNSPLITFLLEPIKYNLEIPPPYFNGFLQSNDKKGKPGYVDMSDSMNPDKLARSALNLNNRLIKWRISPDLDLENIASTKCLLIGAGTLGSHVARNLLGWGITHISFIDCGEVSYSNPARQSLFFQDDVGNNKAETAALNLKRIYGDVVSKGHNIKIPMPGYPIINEQEFYESIHKLDKLITDHDVIFLLTDTRESRWLPTLFCKQYNKLCLTAAIGFDTCVAIRHGKLENVDETDYGCYFCTDVIEPTNTQVDATMDKKCTVSRPGISAMASALVAELMVSCIVTKKNDKSVLTKSNKIPHQIRCDLSTFETSVYNVEKSKYCIACSDSIMKEANDNILGFIEKSMMNTGYLTNVVGLNNYDDYDFDEPDMELSSNETNNNDLESNKEKNNKFDNLVKETSEHIVDKIIEDVMSKLNINKSSQKDETCYNNEFNIDLTEQEKILLLPIMNEEVPKHLKFMNNEMATNVYNSYSEPEKNRLLQIYMKDDIYEM
jgi:ubiquitin-like modifier-activating enzyme ATG7